MFGYTVNVRPECPEPSVFGSTELQCGWCLLGTSNNGQIVTGCDYSCRSCSLCGPSRSLTRLSPGICSSWRKEIWFPGLQSGIKECCVPVDMGSSLGELKNSWVAKQISQAIQGTVMELVQKKKQKKNT